MSKAQQALDRMADNARELGLDYEPAQQKPVAWLVEFENGEQELHFEEQSVGETHTPLYASPPAQRTWVGLTDEEQQAAYDAWQQKDDGWGSFYDLIEAKLKEKNNG